MKEVKRDSYIFKKSSRKGKKYDVYLNGKKLASFGGIKPNGVPYQQYKDKIGITLDKFELSLIKDNVIIIIPPKTKPSKMKRGILDITLIDD